MTTKNQPKPGKRKRITGTVVSNKSNKTVVIKVSREFVYPKYNKIVTRTKKFHAHDENNQAQIGDLVILVESKPYSKLKKWELLKIIK